MNLPGAPRRVLAAARLWVSAVVLSAAMLACADGDARIPARADYAAAVEALTGFIEHEMADKALPALSIALVEDQETVWAEGFGWADPERETPATAATVYRVGSVSKLFTDLGIMQLVERGEIDLDAPITEYLADFNPENPDGEPITLRQLMSHRSGLVREPPTGHYFDDTGTSLEATVRSLNATRLVYPPTTRTKYSNAGVATVGYVLQRLRAEPFADYLQHAVLEPLGMRNSAFQPTPEVKRRLATASMWSYHGEPFVAPTFELGTSPAGSMYAPVTDLARFLSAVFADGVGVNGPVVSATTLREMLTPQFAAPDARTGFGIGFALGELDGHPRVGHGGAIYGFATELAALPDEKLGVVAVTTMDGANAVVGRIADYALQLMLAVGRGDPLPSPVTTSAVSEDIARAAVGRYVGSNQVVEIVQRPQALYAWVRRPGMRLRLRARGDTLIVDDRLSYGPHIVLVEDGIVVGADTLRRVVEQKPRPAPDRWRGLLGEYGWNHNVLYILEKEGQLHALIEWFFLYPLEELGGDAFAFPDWGLYDGERLVFERDDATGRATQVEAAGVVFTRRAIGAESGETFMIRPARPVEEIRRDALAASPPRETGTFRSPDLVQLRSLDPTIRYDIRYATTNNFMGAVFYDEPSAFLQRPGAEALVRAHQRLADLGYGLLIHDAYRPWYVTKMFWDATPQEYKIFVANPSEGSRHNRGSAVDLTLYELSSGQVVEMVGGYDEFSDRSFPEYPGGTSLQRWQRELVRGSMEAEGFAVYEFEWWHFDYKDWREYPILNFTFRQIEEDHARRN
jgi:CubicO group peptidase (beta-lactamase class C family)/D-alanyl-D-alanine dipeptidase